MSNIGVSKTGPEPAGIGQDQGEASEPPLGLADRLDEWLLRLEVWRERPGVAGSLIIACGLLAAATWWLAQPPQAQAVEDSIPMAAAAGGSVDPGSPADLAEPASPREDSGAPVTGHVNSVSDPGDDSGAEAGPSDVVVVHVVGSVERPGLVRLLPGSRIDDALRAAGGPTETADLERLNLAAPIADGMQVRLPARDEEVDEPLVVVPPPMDTSQADETQAGPMNLNTASETELQSLPGVGPATAAAIIGWREDNGGFVTVDDLTLVPGIGPVKLAALRELVAV